MPVIILQANPFPLLLVIAGIALGNACVGALSMSEAVSAVLDLLCCLIVQPLLFATIPMATIHSRFGLCAHAANGVRKGQHDSSRGPHEHV